jgi:hypothetical protein
MHKYDLEEASDTVGNLQAHNLKVKRLCNKGSTFDG